MEDVLPPEPTDACASVCYTVSTVSGACDDEVMEDRKLTDFRLDWGKYTLKLSLSFFLLWAQPSIPLPLPLT